MSRSAPSQVTQATEAFDPQLVEALRAEGARDDHAPGRAIPAVPLAEHRNHTPFPTQYFQSVDQHGEVFHVVVLRASFDMTRVSADGVMAWADEQSPLATEDHWSGAPNDSCPLWESDFAPYKPKCDVLVVNAVSRPPSSTLGALVGGKATRWGCGVAMSWQDAEGAGWQWIKHLAVTGPRRFGRLGLSEPAACDAVAIDWRLACGGQVKRPAQDLKGADGKVTHAAGSRSWEVDERNPVGVGLDTSPGQAAPQLELSLDQPYQGGSASSYRPVSLTPLARAWLPRRALAGTYDNEWLKTQWPLPPTDFDYGYWNCAPADQQIDYPGPSAQITLLNLYAPAPPSSEASRTDTTRWPAETDGRWRGRLPPNELFALWRLHAGPMITRPLNLDTLVVDMASLQIYATYRAVLSSKADVRVVETRMTEVSAAPSSAQKPQEHT